MALQRFYRSIVLRGAALAGGSALTVICSCDSGSDELPDAGCFQNVTLHSSCGFENVTTTCASGAVSCNGTSCTVGTSDAPIEKDCTITAKAGDGTVTTIGVTVGACVFPGFAQVACEPVDAGNDDSGVDDGETSDAAIDASDDGG